jgi:hypothetical protein
MEDREKNKMVEIFSGTSWEAEMVVSLLEDANIPSFSTNNVLNSMVYDPIYSSGVKVMILNSEFKQAKEIVDEYYKNMKTNSD